MNELIAVCSNATCGHAFLSNNITGINTRVVINPNQYGLNCPKCGEMAFLSPGTYSLHKDAVRLMMGPRESFDTLQRIKALLEQATKDAKSKAEVIESVAAESPILAEFLKTINADTFQKWLTQALAILSLVVATYAAFKPSEDEGEDSAKRFENYLKTELVEARQEIRGLKTSTHIEAVEQDEARAHPSRIVFDGLHIFGNGSVASPPEPEPPYLDLPTTGEDSIGLISILKRLYYMKA